MPDPDSILKPIQTTLRWLVVATVFLGVAVGGVVTFAVSESRQTDELARETHADALNNRKALCALRADVKVRLVNSKQFLRDNPQGTNGIPVSVIKQSMVGQRASIKALRHLRC